MEVISSLYQTKKSLAEPRREPIYIYIYISPNYDITLFHKLFFFPKV